MSDKEIKNRCVKKLNMTQGQAEIVLENLDMFASPDFSEMSRYQIDAMLKEVLYCSTHTNKILCAS